MTSPIRLAPHGFCDFTATAPRFSALAALALAAAPLAAAAPPPAPPALVGTWSSYPSALPSLQLPQVPLLGNGHLGCALDAHAAASVPGALGPHSANSFDLWLNTPFLWSCTSCGGTDPDRTVPACCSTAALGGVSLRLTPSFPGAAPLPAFSARQAVAGGTLSATLRTAAGGEARLEVRMHPSRDVLVANLSWAPGGAGDPPALVADIATWVLGDGALPGSWTTGTPAPWATGDSNYL